MSSLFRSMKRVMSAPKFPDFLLLLANLFKVSLRLSSRSLHPDLHRGVLAWKERTAFQKGSEGETDSGEAIRSTHSLEDTPERLDVDAPMMN